MRKAVAILLLLVGCSLSEVVDTYTPREPETYTPRKRVTDSTQRDTARVPISFDVSVDNWGDEEDVECSSN
jgi:hypothetical protein